MKEEKILMCKLPFLCFDKIHCRSNKGRERLLCLTVLCAAHHDEEQIGESMGWLDILHLQLGIREKLAMWLVMSQSASISGLKATL